MLDLNFATVYEILFQARNCNIEPLFEGIIFPLFKTQLDTSPLDEGIKKSSYPTSSDHGNVGKYRKGDALTSLIVQAAKYVDIDKYIEALSTSLVPLLKANSYERIFIAIKKIIESSIDVTKNNDPIGPFPLYTRKVFVENYHFKFTEVLAVIIVNGILKQENDIIVDKLPSDFLKNITNEEILDVDLTDNPSRIDYDLTYTALTDKFNFTFTTIPIARTLPIKNHNHIKAYRLHAQSNQFYLKYIEDFVADNISRYVFSRKEADDYLHGSKRIEHMTFKAVNHFKSVYGDDKLSEHLDEILLYSFLECGLNAPKVFSKVELDTSKGINKSMSSGIHFFHTNIEGLNDKLVFGASELFDDINVAIDNIFNQVINIKNNFNNEYDILDENITMTVFPVEVSSYLRKTILPSNDFDDKPDNAFGLFICYKIDIEDLVGLENSEFRTRIDEKIKKDISQAIDTIYEKINNLKLTGYSFYCYFLPLIDPLNDKKEIMEHALGC